MYLLLFVLWLVFNGKLTLEIVLFGLALTALFAGLLRLLFGYGLKSELRILRKLPLFLLFFLLLLWEVAVANLRMIGTVLGPKRRIEPTVVCIRTDLKTGFARFLLANSITLTPGTLTVESEGPVLTVHCIRPALLENTESSAIVRLLRKMEA